MQVCDLYSGHDMEMEELQLLVNLKMTRLIKLYYMVSQKYQHLSGFCMPSVWYGDVRWDMITRAVDIYKRIRKKNLSKVL